MKDDYNERLPYYIPFYYRVFLKTRKAYRQAMIRVAERAARQKGPKGIIPDEDARWIESKGEPVPNPADAINKSAIWIDEDMAKPEIKALTEKIDLVKEVLKVQKLCFTNTAGTFLTRMFYPGPEQRKLWENAWVIYYSGVKGGDRVLDVGGASTAFTFYLASIGCSVAVVDNDWGNCGTIYNTNYVAKRMNWDLKAYDRDASEPLPFPDNHFDRVFSICTLEHLTSNARRLAMKEIGRVLRPGGIVGLTIDYAHDREMLLTDKGLRFAYRDKLKGDVIRPSGLSIYGNTELIDVYGEKNFLGALFLKKEKRDK